eukprot:255202_1
MSDLSSFLDEILKTPVKEESALDSLLSSSGSNSLHNADDIIRCPVSDVILGWEDIDTPTSLLDDDMNFNTLPTDSPPPNSLLQIGSLGSQSPFGRLQGDPVAYGLVPLVQQSSAVRRPEAMLSDSSPLLQSSAVPIQQPQFSNIIPVHGQVPNQIMGQLQGQIPNLGGQFQGQLANLGQYQGYIPVMGNSEMLDINISPDNLSSPPPSYKPDSVEENPRTFERKARKAEQAREARLKKKQYVEILEAKVEDLQRRISEVKSRRFHREVKRRKLSNGKEEAFLPIQEEAAEEFKPSDEMTAEEIQNMCERFQSEPSDRQKKSDYYLDRVNECVMPGLQVKFLLWIASQKSDFYEKEGLWQSLLKEIGLSEEQVALATQRKYRMKNDRDEVLQIAKMTDDLRTDISEHLTQMSQTINKLRNVMTSEQMVRLFLFGKNTKNAHLFKFVDKPKYKNPVQL